MPMATASQEDLPGGEAGAADEETLERERAEARQLSDRDLREKVQLKQKMLAGAIADRLPDRGKKLRLSLDAMQRELTHRLARDGGTRGPVSLFSSFVVIRFVSGKWA